MASLISYKGLTVLDAASGAGGEAINEDFKALADRFAHFATSDPTSSDGEPDFAAGSRWFNTATETEWICVNPTGSAVWKSITGRSVPTSRSLSTSAPLTGGGDLSANRTLGISAATDSSRGTMSSAHFSRVNTATNSNTADTLVLRDGSGTISVQDLGVEGNATVSGTLNADSVSAISMSAGNISITETVTCEGVSCNSITAGGIAANSVDSDAVLTYNVDTDTIQMPAPPFGTPGLVSGEEYTTPFWLSEGSAGSVTTGVLYAIPIYIPQPLTIASIGILQNSDGGSGTLHQLGLYANNGGIPGSRILDAGTVAANSGGDTVKLITINHAITIPGWYWLAGCTSSGGSFWRCGGQITGGMPCGAGGKTAYQRTSAVTVGSALPSPFGSGSLVYAKNVVPILVFKI